MHNVNVKYYYHSIPLIRMCTVRRQMFMGNEDGMRSSKSLHMYSRRMHNRDQYSSVFFFSKLSATTTGIYNLAFSQCCYQGKYVSLPEHILQYIRSVVAAVSRHRKSWYKLKPRPLSLP